MLQANNLISTNIPQLQLSDTVGKALSLMGDYEVLHLCITNADTFLGIISKDDLLTTINENTIATLQQLFTHNLVLETDHFSKALLQITEAQLSIIPVLNLQRHYIGVVEATKLLHYLNHYIGANNQGAIIILEMETRNFSFSEISRLIETHDAQIVQLNTQANADTGMLQATLKLNKTEVADIIATLQRFDYNILNYYGEEAYTNELQDNYSHLMHYLSL